MKWEVDFIHTLTDGDWLQVYKILLFHFIQFVLKLYTKDNISSSIFINKAFHIVKGCQLCFGSLTVKIVCLLAKLPLLQLKGTGRKTTMSTLQIAAVGFCASPSFPVICCLLLFCK